MQLQTLVSMQITMAFDFVFCVEIPTTATANQGQAVVDIDDSTSAPNTALRETGLSHQDPGTSYGLATLKDTRSQIRIRLRVKPSEPRALKLRFSLPKKIEPTKGSRPSKKCKEKTQPRSQKKSSRKR